MESPAAVQFRVVKGSKFLFECGIAAKDELPTELQRHVVRADELALLRSVDIAITKRLNLVEVDRMIACCRQHPPQALICATDSAEHDNLTAFDDLASYLKQRGRAGVGSISAGMLVLLIPLDDRNDYMRCQIVNAKTTVSEIGAVTTQAAQALQGPQTEAMASPLETAETSDSPVQVVNQKARRHQDIIQPTAGDVAGDASDPYAKLRQEHAAFNAFYHHVLLEWSTKPSDVDSARELWRHA